MRSQAQARGTGWQIQTYFATHALQLLYLVEYADFDTQSTIGRGVVDVSSRINTGDTISLGNASGAASGTDGEVSISYRGVENFWGNSYQWIDGLNRNGSEVFVANEGFESDKFTSPYTLLTDDILSGTRDFVTNITFPDFLMSVGGGSDSSHLHDRNDLRETGNRVARFGGIWADGSVAGGFFWHLARSSSDNLGDSGSRLQIL
jgi:hypothetical protein